MIIKFFPKLRRAIAVGVCGLNIAAVAANAQSISGGEPGVDPISRVDVSGVEFTLSGFVGLELLQFKKQALHSGQSTKKDAFSYVISPELSWVWGGGRTQLLFNPYFRFGDDGYDPERDNFDIRELSFSHYDGDWWIKAGISKVFWGRLESRQTVDIINQVDLSDTADGTFKLGQPMLNFGIQTEAGAFELFILPYFRPVRFPGRSGRLRGSIPFETDPDKAIYESARRENHVDFALRYSAYWDNFDLGLSYFRGTSREPRTMFGLDDTGQTVLIPIYDQIEQYSVDAQATFGAWLLKGEGFYRRGNGDDFFAVGLGAEYSFYSVLGSNSDIALVAEFNYDGRNSTAPLSLFDDELFFGARWTVNNIKDTSLLAGALIDKNTGSYSLGAQFESRLSDSIKVEISAQIFENVDPSETLLYSMRDDDNIKIFLSYNF